MTSRREQARALRTAEIVRLARRQVEEIGAPGLSLRAIARDLGMVSSAIYRYFSSRDELLTRLIVESYERLGIAVEAADAAVRRSDHRRRWRAMAHAIRRWAFANPAEYALLFGSPVPGYAAPPQTIGPATRYTAALTALIVDIEAAGEAGGGAGKVSAPLRRDLRSLRDRYPMAATDAMLVRGLAAWAQVMGTISLELFGHLHNVVNTPGALFDAVVDDQADRLLGTAAPRRTSNPA
ncbi:MAG: TetR/AcrR family transcriptional regulator [Actinobacteria bacterium]|nr:TetR/AcrR family transcriptional regulator [Actinomycetota bacterium]